MLLSPTVGLWVPRVSVSDRVEEDSVLGRILQAGTWYEVCAPKGGVGLVSEVVRGHSRVECGSLIVGLSAGEQAVKTVVAKAGPPDGVEIIGAPMVGLLYRQSAPDQPVYAAEGDVVTRNQTIGLVEVMKTLTPVRAPRDGRIVKWLVENGESVQQQQPIAWLAPEAQ